MCCVPTVFMVHLYETWKTCKKSYPPACVVTKIREEFPEPSGVYVNFDGDDEGADGVSEIIEAWEYMES